MKRFPLPYLIASLALLLGVISGLGLFWLEAAPLAVEAAATRSPAQTAGQRPEKPWDFWTVEIDSLAAELKDARALLAKREEALLFREKRLAAEERELGTLRTELESMRAEIDRRLVEVQAGEVKNLRSLAQTYSNLTPKAAVTLMLELDDVMIVKLLSFMKSDVTGPIFEELAVAAAKDPALAKRIATIAERLRLLSPAKAPATSS
ncbi:hypothetical protein OH491_11060 [Termitidicoccus mucosus]|uniref:Magnesium transporter MgtE intracellular domain-containing protein n=1 Tax=Termitidicoccus mucosus TaxID=1184151 RepID=A0A178IF28_9BACT|nr:hypothetical protein AW736_16290 [Opitutaceae bacterium TSB47]